MIVWLPCVIAGIVSILTSRPLVSWCPVLSSSPSLVGNPYFLCLKLPLSGRLSLEFSNCWFNSWGINVVEFDNLEQLDRLYIYIVWLLQIKGEWQGVMNAKVYTAQLLASISGKEIKLWLWICNTETWVCNAFNDAFSVGILLKLQEIWHSFAYLFQIWRSIYI